MYYDFVRSLELLTASIEPYLRALFVPIAVFSLYRRVRHTFFPSGMLDGVFLSCDHGLDFLHKFMREIYQSKIKHRFLKKIRTRLELLSIP